MAPLRANRPERDWSPEIARRLVFRFLAFWAPISSLVVFVVAFLLTPAFNASESAGGAGSDLLYWGPMLVLGSGLEYIFWHRLTDRAGYYSWMLMWTGLAVVSGAVFAGVFVSHAIRPLEGDTRWVLSGGIVAVTLLGIGLEYLMERR